MYWNDRFIQAKEDGLLNAEQEFKSLNSITQYALEKQLSQIQAFYQPTEN